MSFRKRGSPPVRIVPGSPLPTQDRTSSTGPTSLTASQLSDTISTSPGVRPSPVDGRPTISTGTASLDGLLAGHSGFALGSSLLIEESGTTDYAGSLLRFYAAEGLVQGHQVHVVGVGEYWGRELPGVVENSESKENKAKVQEDKEKMKIAWRYERLGEVDSENSPRAPRNHPGAPNAAASPFCHTFDLTKRLALPSPKAISYLPIDSSNRTSPFTSVIERLSRELDSTEHKSIHRLIIPNLLSPALYPETSSQPAQVLQFLHSLRALLRVHIARLTIMITLPLTLFPRSTGLTRWIELLCDGVIELIPFPHSVDAGPPLSASASSTTPEEKPQGMVRIHRLPVFHERGGGGVGGAGVGDDLAFTLSRRRFVVKPFSLPPIEGDQEAQHGDVQGGKVKVDIDF